MIKHLQYKNAVPAGTENLKLQTKNSTHNFCFSPSADSSHKWDDGGGGDDDDDVRMVRIYIQYDIHIKVEIGHVFCAWSAKQSVC